VPNFAWLFATVFNVYGQHVLSPVYTILMYALIESFLNITYTDMFL